MGLFLCFIFTLCMSANVLFVKSSTVPAQEKLFIRLCIQFIALLPVLQYRSTKLKVCLFGKTKESLKFLLIRGTFATMSICCFYESIQRIPMGDASSISYCSIFFSGLIARIWLKEPYTLMDVLFACLSVVGVVFVSKPPFIFTQLQSSQYGSTEYVGVAFAIIAAFLMGLQFTTTRKLSKTDPVLVIFYFTVVGMVLLLTLLLATNKLFMPCYSEFPNLVLVGITGLFQQTFLVLALRYERTTTFAVMRSTTIFQIFLLQVSKFFFCIALIEYLKKLY